MLSNFDLIAVLLVLTATFAWLNHRFIRLPHSIGLLVMGLIARASSNVSTIFRWKRPPMSLIA